MATTRISVIICTYNPRPDYLRRVLEALQTQSMPFTGWELLLVDNASDDPVSERFDIAWHPNGRHIREQELGLTAARLRGISESRTKLIVFVDDDNVLKPDYLEHAIKIGEDHPFLGAWGGSISPDFEQEPPNWTKKYWVRLAIRNIRYPNWSNDPERGRKPCGAGLCVRTNVAHLYREELSSDNIRKQLGRRGDSLFSTEDTDIVHTCLRLNLGWGLFPQLKVTHLIPDDRLTEDYLLRLVEDMTASATVFNLKNGKPVKSRRGRRRLLRYLNVLFRSGPREARFYLAIEQGKQRGISIAKASRSGTDM